MKGCGGIMSWNIVARETSPCERAGSRHSDWRGDAPDSAGTVGLAARSSQLPSLLAAARGHGLPQSWGGHLELHAGRGVPPARGPWAGMWLPAARMQLLMAQHLLEHWTPSPPSSQHAGARFPSMLLGYPMVSHTSAVLLAGRGPHLEGHPCPSRGTLSAAPCSP